MTKKKPTTQAAAKTGVARTAEPSESARQLKIYEEAVQAFTQRTFEKARNLFLRRDEGVRRRNIADKARSYASAGVNGALQCSRAESDDLRRRSLQLRSGAY